MSGLFFKDLYTLKKYALWYAFVAAIFISAALITGNNAFVLGLSVILPLSVLAATVSADKKDGWTEYALVCGMKPGAIAAEKALLAVCPFLIVAAASAGAAALSQGGFDLRDYLTSLSFAADSMLAALAVSLPLSYRFGTEKARLIVGLIVAAVMCGAVALLSLTDTALIHTALLIVPPVLLSCAAVGSVALTAHIIKTENYRKSD